MLGDGIACLFASLVGGPPVTTYSEVTGAMSLTKVTDPLVFRIAAVTGVLFSLIGKVSALLRSIDQAILGGIMLLLFGTIAGAGISSLLHSRVNLASSRNVVIISVTLTTGIGGAALSFGNFSLSGIGILALVLAAVVFAIDQGTKYLVVTQMQLGERITALSCVVSAMSASSMGSALPMYHWSFPTIITLKRR